MDISNPILQSIDIILDSRLQKLNYDMTIEATIYSVVNLDTGEYKVEYSGNTFSAFSMDPTIQYDKDDTVFVVVPEGNFSNKKIITTTVASRSLSYSQMTALQNMIKDVSPTFGREGLGYDYDKNTQKGVIAGAPPQNANSHEPIFSGPDRYSARDYHAAFQQYSSQYEYIRIKALFKTELFSKHTKGNYGLRVKFYANDSDDAEYQFDINSFNGDPYSLGVWSPQQVVIKAPKNYLLGLKSIELFEEGFEYDRLVENGLVTNQENRSKPNIFVKNVELSFVEILDLTDTTYYLTIVAPKGNVFTPTTSSIDLVGRLVYQGKDLMDKKTCKCKWFKRDLSVMVGNILYDKDAGFGWRPFATTDGTSDFNMLTLTVGKVEYQAEYKLVVIYNGKVTVSAQILVTNLNNKDKYNYELTQVTLNEIIRLQLTEGYVGDWYVSYPDNSYQQLNPGTGLRSVEIQDYLLYSIVTFYCTVYKAGTNVELGILSHVVSTSDSEDDVSITYDGEDQFRYDANGDVTVTDSEKERILQAIVTWKDGAGSRYKLEWVGPDGIVLEPDFTKRHTFVDSMVEYAWVDNNCFLHYTIRQKYRLDYNNNIFTLRLTTLDQKVFNFRKEILFLKDGDQGTNGTTYVIAIRPCEDSDWTKKKSGFQAITYNNGWTSSMRVACYVYRDGELINRGDQTTAKYDIRYKWDKLNVNLTTNGHLGTVSGTGTLAAARYVKCQVTIRELQGNMRTNEVYASYPIDVAVGGINTSLVDIADIPSYVKYTSSGINPSYYSKPLKFIYDDIDLTSTSSIETLSPNILGYSERDGQLYLKPATSFIYEDPNEINNLGLFKCLYDSSRYILHTIIMYLDNYGNEAINGWDGSSILINDDGGGDAYILAPQVGAGAKDSANRFTGVVMGQDSGQKQIGLYGYDKGTNTFGFRADGQAWIGKAGGSGRIFFDGNQSIIKSANFTSRNDAAGMQITLAKGMIETPSYYFDGEKQQFLFKLANKTSSWFKIIADTSDETSPNADGNSSTVFYINGSSNNPQYYLKSKKYGQQSDNTYTGTKIDLERGRITSYDFTIQAYDTNGVKVMEMDSNNSRFHFNIDNAKSNGSFVIHGSGVDLMHVSKNSYYLKSADGQTELNLSNGYLKCENGKIGGWTITKTTITANGVVLHSDGWISIKDSLYAKTIQLNDDGTKGAATAQIGYVIGDQGAGYGFQSSGVLKLYGDGMNLRSTKNIDLKGSIGAINIDQEPGVIGIKDNAIAIVSSNNAGGLRVDTAGTHCYDSAERQTGIYARFA